MGTTPDTPRSSKLLQEYDKVLATRAANNAERMLDALRNETRPFSFGTYMRYKSYLPLAKALDICQRECNPEWKRYARALRGIEVLLGSIPEPTPKRKGKHGHNT